MRKIILIIGLILEILVLVAIYDTYRKTSTGGDIVHIEGQVPFTVDNVQRTYSPGTYVMTRDGLVQLRWYWVYQYWYFTVTLPIVLVLGFLWLSSRKQQSVAAT